jgi:hypothetical protein
MKRSRIREEIIGKIRGRKRTGISDPVKIALEILKKGSRLFGRIRFGASIGILYILGIVVGIGIRSIFIGMVASFALATIPLFYASYAEQKFRADKDRKLLIAMAGIHSEYLKDDVTFVSAVKEALPNIPEPIYGDFKLYVDTVLYFSPDSHHDAVINLDRSIGNYFFSEYMSFVIMVEDGERSLKYTMSSIPEEFNSLIEINDEFSHTIDRCNQSFITTMLTLPLMLGFLKVVSNEYFLIMTETLVGEIVIACLILEFAIAGVIIRRLNGEVNFEI